MNTIIVSPSELAVIWQCNVRTIKTLQTAGLVVKLGPAKYDLIESTKLYVEHLRRVASGLVTVDSKVAANVALTRLRNAQREAIERKSGDYALIEDVKKVFRTRTKRAKKFSNCHVALDKKLKTIIHH